ncbi:MAG: hypothetical protein Q4E86_12440 [Lachnospiraceae bacterium]|nr:hypothetical protein [Lachnospiraceae bacterium]MDO5551496.1 hypothetical protein [Lachnospiraceae bacterium]
MGEDRRRRKFHKEQHDYVNQLRNYRRQGIPIFIDGKAACQERDWYKIFEVRDDGATYMADFVTIEKGIVSEIHFDLVYLDLDARQAWEGQKRLEEDRRRAQMQHYQSVIQKNQRIRDWEQDDKKQDDRKLEE